MIFARVFLCATVVACGGTSEPSDGGARDTGSDASDAGSDTAFDAALPPVTCTDAIDDVYTANAVGAAGQVVACAADGSMTAAELDGLISADNITVVSGADRYRIAYRTERQPGVAGVGSALLLIPDAPRADSPVVVVNHGTAGHADACAPSTRAATDADLVLPWVASGFVTIAVDYAGLGTAGIQGYGDAFDTAQSAIDGARAALQFLGEQRPIVFTGHSQGGGAALFAQGLAPTYAPELSVTHTIAFAGGAAERLELTPAAAPFLGRIPITGGLGVPRATFAMTMYADFANRLGEARAGDGFHPSIRATVEASVGNDCIFAMATNLAMRTDDYTPPTTFGELADPAFLTAVQACVSGDAGCNPEGMAFVEQRTTRGFIPPSPAGGGVLLLSGSADILHTPAKFACVLESTRAAGVMVNSCLLMGSTHFDITANGIGAALEYVISGIASCPPMTIPAPACAP